VTLALQSGEGKIKQFSGTGKRGLMPEERKSIPYPGIRNFSPPVEERKERERGATVVFHNRKRRRNLSLGTI